MIIGKRSTLETIDNKLKIHTIKCRKEEGTDFKVCEEERSGAEGVGETEGSVNEAKECIGTPFIENYLHKKCGSFIETLLAYRMHEPKENMLAKDVWTFHEEYTCIRCGEPFIKNLLTKGLQYRTNLLAKEV